MKYSVGTKLINQSGSYWEIVGCDKAKYKLRWTDQFGTYNALRHIRIDFIDHVDWAEIHYPKSNNFNSLYERLNG